MSERYVCIHGHFYQPPRENPWLEAVELQDSAHPYHDWNERITAECYEPNAASRILDHEDRIVLIGNNYARISFNFGPTLLSWLEENAGDVYTAIRQADAESRARFSGHGSALAQPYNHMILPLANRRDRITQVRWGVADFRRRFDRDPEGMWLPETAVDLETLDILAEHGLRFTILAPRQAARVRRKGEEEWTDVTGARVPPTRAYEQRLPSGRSIVLFFYDGPASRAVAFERLLVRGEDLAHRIVGCFADTDEAQLVHLATDGETYGHHHRHGDMALAYALDTIESHGLAKLTNYGEFLERHPPEHEVEIVENSSWSCVHGIERWRSDCGCNTGRPGWHQQWRAPLREALDWLRDELAGPYAEAGGALLRDPWAARDAYIDVILDRRSASVDAFFDRHAHDGADRVQALRLLELQRHALLMYTSCGWFFDELSGIETVQVLQYAGRAVQLARDALGDDLEPGFLERLGHAPSNLDEHPDGRSVYQRFVQPAMVDLAKVGAHYALSSPFEDYDDWARIYSYHVEREDYTLEEAGRARLALGRARVTSRITEESELFSFAVVHAGDHNLSGGVRVYRDEEAYGTLCEEVRAAFRRADQPEVFRLLDRYFERLTYTIQTLFRDEQRKILDVILETTLADAEAVYRHLYDTHAPLMRFLADVGVPQPAAFRAAAQLVLTHALRRELAEELPDPARVHGLLERARTERVDLDGAMLTLPFEETLESVARTFALEPDALAHLELFVTFAELAAKVPFEVERWAAQNTCWEMAQDALPRFRRRADGGDEAARAWVALFDRLCRALAVRVE